MISLFEISLFVLEHTENSPLRRESLHNSGESIVNYNAPKTDPGPPREITDRRFIAGLFLSLSLFVETGARQNLSRTSRNKYQFSQKSIPPVYFYSPPRVLSKKPTDSFIASYRPMRNRFVEAKDSSREVIIRIRPSASSASQLFSYFRESFLTFWHYPSLDRPPAPCNHNRPSLVEFEERSV